MAQTWQQRWGILGINLGKLQATRFSAKSRIPSDTTVLKSESICRQKRELRH